MKTEIYTQGKKLSKFLATNFYYATLDIQMRPMGFSNQFLKTTSDGKAFFYKFYQLEIYHGA